MNLCVLKYIKFAVVMYCSCIVLLMDQEVFGFTQGWHVCCKSVAIIFYTNTADSSIN